MCVSIDLSNLNCVPQQKTVSCVWRVYSTERSERSADPGIRLEPGNREFPVRVKLPGKWHSNEGKTEKISFQYIYDRENDTKNRPKPGKKRTKY
jgi:hypothetical protein